MERNEIVEMAKNNGWELFAEQTNIQMLSFVKEGMRVNVYHSRMTVGTCITHPKKGKTQLFRKLVSRNLLGKIFENPRHHTGAGYYKREDY